jgi:hypothetical protein
MTFGQLETIEQAEICLGAITAAAITYYNAGRRHFDEPRHGAEHYLQAKLFDSIAGKQKEAGYVTLETSPKEVLSELGVADPTVLHQASVGSQRFDLVTGSTAPERSPEVLIELKRDLADGLIAADVLKVLHFDRALRDITQQRLKSAICLGLRRISTFRLDYDQFKKRVELAVLGVYPDAQLLFKYRKATDGDCELLAAGVFIDLR